MLESIKPEPEDDPPSWMNHIKVIDCASVKPQEEYSHSDVFAAGHSVSIIAHPLYQT